MGLRALCCGSSDPDDTQNTPARPAQPRPTKTTQNTPTTIEKSQVTSDDMISEKVEIPTDQEKEQNQDNQEKEQKEEKEEKKEKPGPVDLWKKAFDSLDPSSQAYISVGDISATAAIDCVIQDTTARYEEWKKGGLKIHRKDADDIDIQKSVEKIINAAQRTRDVITAVVSFDPTGHASSAWTVISFGMSIVQNRSIRQGAVFAASDYLAERLAYYAVIDTTYRNQGVESDSHLDKAILGVYEAILKFTVEVKKARDENEGKRLLNSVFALTDTPLAALKEAIDAQIEAAERWKTLAQTLGDRKKAAEHLEKTDKLLDSMRKMISQALSSEDEKTMNWLSTAPYSDRQRAMQKKRTGDTGKWVFELPEYNKWSSTPGSILWLSGASGCGKSVLCSTVVSDIEEECKLNPSKFLAYWYFQFGVDATQAVDSMVRSFIRQLSRSPVMESVSNLRKEHQHNGSQPASTALINVLENVLSRISGEVYLIFDALDECPESPQTKERRSLLSLVTRLLERYKDKIHILATSRRERDIERVLGKFPNVDLEARLADDVRKFVTTSIEEGDLGQWQPEVQKVIIETLLSLRERRFRWAELQIMELEKCNNLKEIDQALKTIPHSLEETYRKVLGRIDSKDILTEQGIFALICLSPVALDLGTIAAMLNIIESAILRICTTSLVNVFEGKIQFAHFSVQEFIVFSDDVCLPAHHPCQFTIPGGQTNLLEKTADFLLEQTDELGEFGALRLPAFLYSANYWHIHLAGCGDLSQIDPEIQFKIDRLFTTPTVYSNWIRVAYRDNDARFLNEWSKIFREDPAPLHMATYLGLLKSVEALVTQGADPAAYSSLPEFGGTGTSISVAAYFGHLDIVQFFLHRTSMHWRQVNYFLGYLDHRNADKGTLEKILRTLLDKGMLCRQSHDPRTSNTLREELLEHTIACRVDSGVGILDIFLDWRPEVCVPITDEFIARVIVNGHVSKECLHLIFQRCDIQMPYIPESTIREGIYRYSGRYAGFTCMAAFAYIAEEWPNKLEMYEPLIARFAECECPKVFESLLRTRKDDIHVTQDVLACAVKNREYPNLLLFLWPYREPDTEITQSMILDATSRERHSEELWRFLLEQFTSNFTLDEETLRMCLYRCTDGFATLKLLLEYTPSSLWESEELMEAICNHADPVNMLSLLRQMEGFCAPITEDILCSAATNGSGHLVLHWLAQMHQGPLPVTEQVLISAIKNLQSGDEVLRVLMEHFPSPLWPDTLFEWACENKDAMVFLLDQHHSKDLLIDGMLEALRYSGKGSQSRDVLQILLERDILKVDEKLIETLAPNPPLLVCMLLFNPNVPITHEAILSATSNCSSMRLLFEARGHSLHITEDVLIAAIEARADKKMYELLLDIQGSLPLTDKVLDKARESRYIGASLLKVIPDSDVRNLWHPSWCDTQLPIKDRIKNLISVLVIQDSKMSDEMLEEFPYDPENQQNHGFDEFIEMMCTEGALPVLLPGTERAAEIILERCGNRAVESFLKCEKYPYSITDNSIQAATRNGIADRGKLISFLEQKRSQIRDDTSAFTQSQPSRLYLSELQEIELLMRGS